MGSRPLSHMARPGPTLAMVNRIWLPINFKVVKAGSGSWSLSKFFFNYLSREGNLDNSSFFLFFSDN